MLTIIKDIQGKLSRLKVPYEYVIEVKEGQFDETHINFKVIAFPSVGHYHLTLTKVTGLNQNFYKEHLSFKQFIFNTETIQNHESHISLKLKSKNGDTFMIDNIVGIHEFELDEINITQEDIKSNIFFQKATQKQNKKNFNIFKSIFKKK